MLCDIAYVVNLIQKIFISLEFYKKIELNIFESYVIIFSMNHVLLAEKINRNNL